MSFELVHCFKLFSLLHLSLPQRTSLAEGFWADHLRGRSQHHLAPTYLRAELYVDQQTPTTTFCLINVSGCSTYTRLSTVDDRAFPVAAARLWNSLPSQSHRSHVTAPHSLSLHLLLSSKITSLLTFLSCFLTLLSYLYSVRAVTRHFGHFNSYYIFSIYLHPVH